MGSLYFSFDTAQEAGAICPHLSRETTPSALGSIKRSKLQNSERLSPDELESRICGTSLGLF